MTLVSDAQALKDDLIQLRRSIHRHPEVGLQLPRTQALVLSALDGLPIEIHKGQAVSSVVGVIRGSQPGPTVLLRGDMDALPLTEETGVEYASEVDGSMHACGHDLHTTMLVGAARLLSARRDQIQGNVTLMFQPGEEGFHGARYMIEEGVLDITGERPVAAYAIHVGGSERGVFTSRSGPTSAASDELTITVRGVGGHGAAPQRGKDPIPVACEIVTALQTIVTRQVSAFDTVVVTVGSFHAGTKSNIIPDTATLLVTVRTYDKGIREQVKESITRLAKGIASAHGIDADVHVEPGYPAGYNHPAEAEFAARTATALFGAERVNTQPQHRAAVSEDMAYVFELIPGAMTSLGTLPDGVAPGSSANHSPRAVFDDDVVADGATFLAELALRRLAAATPAEDGAVPPAAVRS